MRHNKLPVSFDFFCLTHFLNVDIAFLFVVEIVVAVISHFLKHQSVSRCECYIDSVFSEGIVHKMLAIKVSVEDLDD